MDLWQWLVDAALLLALVAAVPGWLLLRRRILSRNGGTFELAHRVRADQPGHGWVLGLGRYHGDRLEWFRIFSLGFRASRSWPRRDLAFSSTREPDAEERVSLFAGHLIVQCQTPDGLVELAMSSNALVGLQSWLEAAPPGEARRPA